MNGKPITKKEIDDIIFLRKTGHSLTEIRNITKRGNSSVFKHINGVQVLPEYASILRRKQGGTSNKANGEWRQSQIEARRILGGSISREQRLCILLALYWGEGNKRELSMINSDPGLIKVFIECLYDLGVPKEKIKINLRLYNTINKEYALEFWSNFLSIEKSMIQCNDIIQGNKIGKLKYGMCRVRVAKSAPYFKLLMSLISHVKEQFNAAVVQRIEQGTPKP